jgi:nicotinamide mononucleotide (NMN) deamidase PncC
MCRGLVVPLPHQQPLIERIHATATPMVLAVTGGGSGAISALLEVPGASATVLAAVVPYSPAALRNWLGGDPDQATSERTARAMAMSAFQKARAFSDAEPRALRGIGATASLATNHPKRGAHRIHVAWQSADTTVVTTCELSKGERTRAEEEQIATQLILAAAAEAAGIDADMRSLPNVQRREQHAPPAWTELLLGERRSIAIAHPQSAARPGSPQAIRNPQSKVLFPGAFNPLHPGHEKMAAIAAKRCGKPVTWELSIANVDKPPLDFIETADRLAGLANRPVLLTSAPTIVEKAALAPGCVFIVGADTILRIADPRYYGGDAVRRDAAVTAIAAEGCRFLVFGRKIDSSFCSLGQLNLPPALVAMCEEVPESEFRDDAASSGIRGETRAAS